MKRLKLRAAVHERVTGNAELHSRRMGDVHPTLVEIEQDDGGYYLFYLDGWGSILSSHLIRDSRRREETRAGRA
jgi:hypothetical protein